MMLVLNRFRIWSGEYGRSFAKWYDFFMSPLEKRKFSVVRRKLLNNATGNVLEIGSGTGINFPLYSVAAKVTAIEPSEHMIDRSRDKQSVAKVPIEVVHGGAEKLPFSDNQFDTVVATLVFCTIPNVDLAMEEMKRVCKPGGRILLFEHVKMENPFLSKLQDVLTPFWKKICDGCRLNRDTISLLHEHGLKITSLQTFYRGLFIVVEVRNDRSNTFA
ncbi:class I SAM-dependent methyltransferase [Neobacillus sp. PS3-34]|uniref:class I SAM-dependent methyltransferase n=1 Tax=Neobacillus sp. PS3-34 TaxID=3070678 RepID=UPI0027DEF9AC|nr:class I SAM-dependent methyltransferase [Neobacillus sp. PS3-34]WML48285.1 class I SAM-dependent methyltransferase [Neobacillus sp. PS3-34]